MAASISIQRIGSSAAFISAGGYHHHIGLNTWESAGGSPPAPGTTGLYHLAIVYPTRADLGRALKTLIDRGIQLDGAADHGVSEALYLRDPDQNGVELLETARRMWPRTPTGELAMYSRPLDLASLLAAARARRRAKIPAKGREMRGGGGGARTSLKAVVEINNVCQLGGV